MITGKIGIPVSLKILSGYELRGTWKTAVICKYVPIKRKKWPKPTYVCVYCEKPSHKSSKCELVSGTPQQRLILLKKECAFIVHALNTVNNKSYLCHILEIKDMR